MRLVTLIVLLSRARSKGAMGKPLEVSDMPPLSREMHLVLRQLEKRMCLDLFQCCGAYSLDDEHAAFEYVRTAAIEFLDFFYLFYSNIPDPKFREHWIPASEKFAFGRVLKCIKQVSVVNQYFMRSNDRIDRIKRTISDHASRVAPNRSRPPFNPPLPPEVQAQMDLARSDSVTTRIAQPLASTASRKVEIDPFLQSKGWSLLDWANESNVAYHTVADYVSGKRTPYASTRKKLAEALGLSIQQLPK